MLAQTNIRQFYKIQQVANLLGVYKGTIVNYEKKRIFPKPKRHPINNYRIYTKDEVDKMTKILNGEIKIKH